MIKRLDPYLYFDGNAQQALDLYTRVLGAEVDGLLRVGEVPAHADTCLPPDPRRTRTPA